MITQNPELGNDLTRQQRRDIAREEAKYGKQNAQSALNSLLWKIIVDNGGKVNIPCSEMKAIPNNAALKITRDSQTDILTILAAIQPTKSGIVLPNNDLIT